MGRCLGTEIEAQEWITAIGSSTKVRVAQVEAPGTWVVLYEPQWTADGLLARPERGPGECLFCPNRSAQFDTLKVDWHDIVSLERHTRGNAARGMFLGALFGIAGSVALILGCGESDCLTAGLVSVFAIVPDR